jgi:hypothetical protein
MPVPNYLDLFIYQNSTFEQSIVLTDINGKPLNLTNCVVTGTIKNSYASTRVAANFETEIANTANGNIILTLSYDATYRMRPSRYVYDIMLFDVTNNTATRALEGTAYLEPGVTSPYIKTK